CSSDLPLEDFLRNLRRFRTRLIDFIIDDEPSVRVQGSEEENSGISIPNIHAKNPTPSRRNRIRVNKVYPIRQLMINLSCKDVELGVKEPSYPFLRVYRSEPLKVSLWQVSDVIL